MPAELEEYGFGTIWTDFYTDCYEGFLPNMSDYHMHRYYEISLILSGDVKVLLPDAVQQGTQCRLVLTRPMTSHLIVCQPQLLYKRINLLFSPDYLVDYVPEWKQLLGCFPKKGGGPSHLREQQRGLLRPCQGAARRSGSLPPQVAADALSFQGQRADEGGAKEHRRASLLRNRGPFLHSGKLCPKDRGRGAGLEAGGGTHHPDDGLSEIYRDHRE